MKLYTIKFKNSALKEFRKLPKAISNQIAIDINDLAKTPRPHGYIKMKGEKHTYRIRSGDYRVIYEIKDRILVILIVTVGHRKQIYRKV